MGNTIIKSPSLVNNLPQLQNKDLTNLTKSEKPVLQKKIFSLISSQISNLQENGSSNNLKESINLKSSPFFNTTSSKNLDVKGSLKITYNNKINRMNTTYNFDGLRFHSLKKIMTNMRYIDQTHESAFNKDSLQKAKKISFEKNNKDKIINIIHNSNTIIDNINTNKLNYLMDNVKNNQELTTKSGISERRNSGLSPKNNKLVNFNPDSTKTFLKKEHESQLNNNNKSNIISINDALQSSHYKSTFSSTLNFNPNTTNNIKSSILCLTQLNLGSIAANSAAQQINDSITNTTDSDLASNRSFYNHINNLSIPKKKYIKQTTFSNNNINNTSNKENSEDSNIKNNKLPNQTKNKRKIITLLSNTSLNTLNVSRIPESNINNLNDLNKVSEKSLPGKLIGINSQQKRNNNSNINSLNQQQQPNILNENSNHDPNLTINSNHLNFNKTFHSNSQRNSFSNKHLLNNTARSNVNGNDFFSAQLLNFSNTTAKKRLLPHLIKGFKSIESDMTDIKTNLSKAIKQMDDSIEHCEKHKSKHNREFADETENTNDVFLYGNNGQGYYMSNQKIMVEASILNRMKCENIFKHKRFFSQRFNLKSNDQETVIGNGLSFGTEKKFKKIEEYLDETEEMKKRAIKHIKNHQMKVRMEALNENSDEDILDDVNFCVEKNS